MIDFNYTAPELLPFRIYEVISAPKEPHRIGNVVYYPVDPTSRWFKLFGTPERAARTLESMELDNDNWCNGGSGNYPVCKACPYEYDYYGCYLPDGFSLLEWLIMKGESDGDA